MTLLNDADKVYIGSTLASAVYAGAERVWPPEAPGGPWTPADIAADIAFWLRLDLVTGIHGAEIAALPDHGPDGLNFAKATATPAYVIVGLNGMNVGLFGLAPFVCAATQFNDFAVYAVWKGFSEGGLYRWMDHDYAGGFWIGRDVPGSWGGGIQQATTPFGNFITPVDATNWHITVFGRAGTTGRVRSDGGTLNSTPTVFGVQTALVPIHLAGYQADNSYASTDLYIAEVLMLDANVMVNMEKIEGYLAHKWALTGNLPAGHPYKAVAP